MQDLNADLIHDVFLRGDIREMNAVCILFLHHQAPLRRQPGLPVSEGNESRAGPLFASCDLWIAHNRKTLPILSTIARLPDRLD